MDELIEFLTSQEVITVVMIAIAICVVGTIYFVLERLKEKKKIFDINNNDILEENYQVPILNEKVTNSVNNIVETKKAVEQNVVVPVVVEKEVEVIKPIIEEKPQVIPIEEFEKQKEQIQDDPVTIENIYNEVKKEVKMQKEQEELKYTNIEPNKEEAKEELRKATEELMKQQEIMNEENIDLTKFEQEQEENAIISMDELLKKGESLYTQNEVVQYEDEGNEPISLEDLERRMNQIKIEAENLGVDVELKKEEVIEPVTIENIENISVNEEVPTVKLDDFYSVKLKDAYKEDHIFKSSPIISPIFGIEKEDTVTNIELENTANYEKLDDEIRKTNEFLATLKELKKKLE